LAEFLSYIWRPLIEILVLAALIYSVLAFLRGSRGAGIVRGLGAILAVVVIVFLLLATALQLHVLTWLLTNVAGVLFIALIVIFQPELRSALVRVGQSPVFTSFVEERWDANEQITKAVTAMSLERTGALIALQRSVGLKTYTDGGVGLGAEVSAELLISIFKRNAPLHDGAVVIKGDRVVAAACLFPLSENPELDAALGTRHRAAVGVTEESDAAAIVVSEQTGEISVARNGSLERRYDEKMLRKLLRELSSEEGFAGPRIEDAV